MTRPTLVDVAKAILEVQGDPEYRYFKSSRVRAHLQATRRFTAVAGQLNAQCQPHLGEMRHRGWIDRVHLENQERNIPYRIVDEAALRDLVTAGSSDYLYDQTLASSLSGDQALSRIEDRLAETLERIHGTLERIEEKILPGRTEEAGSFPKSTDGESPSVGAETQSQIRRMMSVIYEFASVLDFYNKCDEEDRELFKKLLDWCVRTAIDHGKKPRMVRGYAGQPSGYNQRPQITFPELRVDGRAKAGTRLFSVPLVAKDTAPLTIIIPNAHKSKQAQATMIAEGRNSFRPLNLHDFLANPGHFFEGGAARKA